MKKIHVALLASFAIIASTAHAMENIYPSLLVQHDAVMPLISGEHPAIKALIDKGEHNYIRKWLVDGMFNVGRVDDNQGGSANHAVEQFYLLLQTQTHWLALNCSPPNPTRQEYDLYEGSIQQFKHASDYLVLNLGNAIVTLNDDNVWCMWHEKLEAKIMEYMAQQRYVKTMLNVSQKEGDRLTLWGPPCVHLYNFIKHSRFYRESQDNVDQFVNNMCSRKEEHTPNESTPMRNDRPAMQKIMSMGIHAPKSDEKEENSNSN